MSADIYRKRDFTTGAVATALGVPRQNVTDILRRAHLPTSGDGAHARLSFAQAVAVGAVRRLSDSGFHVKPAVDACRGALPALEQLVAHVARYPDPIAYLNHGANTTPLLVAVTSHDDEQAETMTASQIVTLASLADFARDVAKGRPFAVVPLLPIIEKLATGLGGAANV